MTTKTISGTYANGYTLAAKYAGVSVTPTGLVSGPAGAYPGGNGGGGLTLPSGGTLINRGRIGGGNGGNGQNASATYVPPTMYYGGYWRVNAYAGNGGAGAVGVAAAASATITNLGTISGGSGGYGGNGFSTGPGGASGAPFLFCAGAGSGAAGISLSGGGKVLNEGLITGGAGSYGGSNSPGAGGGNGGSGGAGVVLGAAGAVVNDGTIIGGAGGGGGVGGYDYFSHGAEGAGGAGIDLRADGTITNHGVIEGGAPGTAFFGQYVGSPGDGIDLAGGTVVNGSAADQTAIISGRYGASLAGVGEVVNWGTIEGTYGAVELGAAGDVLIAEGGSTFIGQVTGDGGTLELRAGPAPGTLDGVGGFGKASVADGSSWRLGGLTTITSAWSIGLTSTFTVTGTLTGEGDLRGVTTNQGELLVAAGQTLSLRGGTLTNLAGGVLKGGTIALGAGGTLQLPDNSAIATLDAVVELNGAGGQIRSLDTATSKQVTLGQSLTNVGAQGTIGIAGDTVALDGLTLSGGTLSGGTFILGAGGVLQLADNDPITTLDATVELTGAGGTIESLDTASSTEVTLQESLASITASGTLVLAGGSWSGSTLANAGLITGYGAGSIGIDFQNACTLLNTGLVEGAVGVWLDGAGTVTNFGTIDGTGGTAVQFGSASDVLVAEGGSDFIGVVVGGGGTLDLAGGTGTLSGLGGTATLTGAVSATVTGFGAYDIGAGSAWTLTGDSTIAAGRSLTIAGLLTNAGTVQQAAIVTLASGSILNATGAAWDLANGVAPASGATGAFTNAGTLTRMAATGVNHVGVDFTSTGTVAIVGGTLEFDGPVNSFAGTVSGGGTLAFGGGVSTLGPGLTLSTAAVAIKGAATQVLLDESLAWSGVWTQLGGTVSVAVGGKLTFTGAGDTFTGTLTGAGTVDFAGGSDTLKTVTLSAAHMAIDTAGVTLQGPIVLTGVLTATTADLVVAAGGAALSGGGTLVLTDTAANSLHGASATARLTNGDRIQGAGQLGGGTMSLVNQAAGSIIGNDALALVIDTGAETIANAGLIEAAGAGGVTIQSAVDNTGTLTVAKGSLTADGAVSGAGKVLIEGGTADFAGAFTESVTFTAAGGELELARSQTYTGTITGFSKTGATLLDLGDIAFGAATKATYGGTTTSGTLTVTDGTHTSKIKLAGNYTTSTWTLSSDGHGGTKIVDPTAPAKSPNLFLSAMADFGAPSGGPIAAGSEPWRATSPGLAAPGA